MWALVTAFHFSMASSKYLDTTAEGNRLLQPLTSYNVWGDSDLGKFIVRMLLCTAGPISLECHTSFGIFLDQTVNPGQFMHYPLYVKISFWCVWNLWSRQNVSCLNGLLSPMTFYDKSIPKLSASSIGSFPEGLFAPSGVYGWRTVGAFWGPWPFRLVESRPGPRPLRNCQWRQPSSRQGCWWLKVMEQG